MQSSLVNYDGDGAQLLQTVSNQVIKVPYRGYRNPFFGYKVPFFGTKVPFLLAQSLFLPSTFRLSFSHSSHSNRPSALQPISVGLPIHPPLCRVCLFSCVCRSFCHSHSVRLSVCLSVCPSVRLSVFPSVRPSVRLSVCLWSIRSLKCRYDDRCECSQLTLLEKWPEKCFRLFNCYCWAFITKEFIYLRQVLRPLKITPHTTALTWLW